MSADAIVRAVLTGSDGNELPCQFNPSTVQQSKPSTWSAQPTRGSAKTPRPQFVGTGPEILTAKLLFDDFDTMGGTTKGVPKAVQQLFDWTCVPDDPQGTNPTSGGISGRRSALLGDCDSLAGIAYQEYGDPGLWRGIAVANGVEDPARVPA